MFYFLAGYEIVFLFSIPYGIFPAIRLQYPWNEKWRKDLLMKTFSLKKAIHQITISYFRTLLRILLLHVSSARMSCMFFITCLCVILSAVGSADTVHCQTRLSASNTSFDNAASILCNHAYHNTMYASDSHYYLFTSPGSTTSKTTLHFTVRTRQTPDLAFALYRSDGTPFTATDYHLQSAQKKLIVTYSVPEGTPFYFSIHNRATSKLSYTLRYSKQNKSSNHATLPSKAPAKNKAQSRSKTSSHIVTTPSPSHTSTHKPKTPSTSKPTTISFTKTFLRLHSHSTYKLKFKSTSFIPPSTRLYWRSSDTSIATVHKGKITTLRPGIVLILCETHTHKKTCCTIKVTP